MASNIVPGNVDGTFPKAGQDNSSQGFRDNFLGIKNNFTEAKTEIEAIQSNKANLDSANNFAGNTISNAVLKDNGESIYMHGTVASGSITLNHENISPDEIEKECRKLSQETVLPCYDVLTMGSEGITRVVEKYIKTKKNG